MNKNILSYIPFQFTSCEIFDFWICIQNMSSFCIPSESDNIYLHSLLYFNVWVYFWVNCFQDFFYCLPKPIMHACLLFIPKTTDIVHWLTNERFLCLPNAVPIRRMMRKLYFSYRKPYSFIKVKSIDNLNDTNVQFI